VAGIEASGSKEGGELNDEGRFHDSHHFDIKNGCALRYVTLKRIVLLLTLYRRYAFLI
jgi:hypothetical protein